MELGDYKVKLNTLTKGLTVEVYTIHEEIPASQYCKIMKDVMHYLGSEGFFHEALPKQFGIYNKFGQLVDPVLP
jgi:hypothetical protein